MEYAIQVKDVSMRFNLSNEKIDSLKEYLIRGISGKLKFKEFYALKEVSFNISKGNAFAIMGANGSGKSTLLKVIAGIFKPTQGRVMVDGSISPLIELGAGFDVDLTAKENIYLNGAVLGYSKQFIENQLEQIIDFSELEEFVNVPLKNYSSGMIARLGFSIATIVKPDILIVDEILAVGDYAFQMKCEKKMKELMFGGTTLLFVSHSTEQVLKICTDALLLKKGRLVMLGSAKDVCDLYIGGASE